MCLKEGSAGESRQKKTRRDASPIGYENERGKRKAKKVTESGGHEASPARGPTPECSRKKIILEQNAFWTKMQPGTKMHLGTKNILEQKVHTGTKTILEENHPGIKIIPEQKSTWNRMLREPGTKFILEQNADERKS